jgi:hypothetical protein
VTARVKLPLARPLIGSLKVIVHETEAALVGVGPTRTMDVIVVAVVNVVAVV